MNIVVIRVPEADLSKEFATMRAWFDRNRCTPPKFTSKRDDGVVSVCIEFMDNPDAERFKEEFDQAKASEDQHILIPRENQWVLGSTDTNSISLVTKDTMAQACWCRLMAEEVRTEADEIVSSSARETMQIVAETWDRLAESIEGRLSNS